MNAVLSSLRHLVLTEVAIWVSLWRWGTRRPAVPPHGAAIPYARVAAPIVWLFIWGSAIEVVAVDLVVTHVGWDVVRVPLLVLGTWGVLWMLGLLASMRTRPHVLTADSLLLRGGLRAEVVVPLDAVAGARTVEHELSSTMRNVEEVDGRLLVGVSGRTNVEVTLVRPCSLTTP
ncbi:MAG TPA: hypothetical protein VF728_11060, partial [Nocardioides sp.]